MKKSSTIPFLIIIVFIAAAIMLMLTGCAGYKINKDGSVDSYGVLRTLTVREEYYEAGAIRSKTISTESTTKDALLGIDQLIDTTVDTYSKLKP